MSAELAGILQELLPDPTALHAHRPHLPDDLSAHLGRIMPRLCRALGRGTLFRLAPRSFPEERLTALSDNAAMEQPDMNIVSNVSSQTRFSSCVPRVS